MAEKEKAEKTLQNNNASQKEEADEAVQHNNVSQKKTGPVRIAQLELKTEFYKETVQNYKESINHMKWFIGIALVFIIYIAIVKSIDIYNWEKKADKTISTIDSKVENSLTEIGIKGDATVKYISQNAKLYLDLTVCWHKLSEARQKGDKRTMKKMYGEINKLAELIEKREKNKEIDLEETTFIDTFQVQEASITSHYTPMTLISIDLYEEEHYEQDLIDAEEAADKGIEKGEENAYYSKAITCAHRNNEDECRKYLQVAKRIGELPKDAADEPAFDNMRDKEWFKDIWDDDSGK